jgi:hypothetical protein
MKGYIKKIQQDAESRPPVNGHQATVCSREVFAFNALMLITVAPGRPVDQGVGSSAIPTISIQNQMLSACLPGLTARVAIASARSAEGRWARNPAK